MSAPVHPGEVLAGKYRVERVLGVGGMGVVVAARHLQLDQSVALKFLLPDAIANAEASSRFLREARNAVRLKSEHVARVIDVGTLETGAPYIVMEYLEGCDLAGLLAQHRALAIPVAVDYVLQACDAIAEAHSLGIVHRDLKPQNLFVTRGHDGSTLIKVLDFGISKSSVAGDLVATRTQAVMGSPAYMSPEQMRSAKLVDARTDVWALGVILYQLVLGHVPWDAETFTELCFKVAMDPLPPFPAGSALPPGFEDVVRRCLEKDLHRRFPDVYHLAVALHPYAPPQAQLLVERIGRVLRGETGNPVAKTQLATPVPSPGTWNDAAGQKVTLHGRRRAAIGGVIAAVGIAGIVATAFALRGGGGPAQPSALGQPTAATAPAAAVNPSPAPTPPAATPTPPAATPTPPAATPTPTAAAPTPPAATPTAATSTPPAATPTPTAAAPSAAPPPASASKIGESPPGSGSGAKPRDRDRHRTATPTNPPAPPASRAKPTDKPPATPDPLSSPD